MVHRKARANGWVVRVTKQPTGNYFRDGYFPRQVYYKADAEALAREVRQKGGEATVERYIAPKE